VISAEGFERNLLILILLFLSNAKERIKIKNKIKIKKLPSVDPLQILCA
jgi:hypothetical protein